MKMTPNLQRRVETRAPKVSQFVIAVVCCMVFAELDPEATEQCHLISFLSCTHYSILILPWRAPQQPMAFLAYFQGRIYSSNWHKELWIPRIQPRRSPLRKAVSWQGWNHVAAKVRSCAVFWEVLRAFKVMWKSWEPQPSNHYFCFYFKVPWYNPDLKN